MNCEAQGKTTLLFTKIPFFQGKTLNRQKCWIFSEVIVVAFECEECGYKNNELQPAGKLKDQGQNIVLTCIKPEVGIVYGAWINLFLIGFEQRCCEIRALYS